MAKGDGHGQLGMQRDPGKGDSGSSVETFRSAVEKAGGAWPGHLRSEW